MVLSFLAASGVTLDILGCSLSNYNWWPIFVIIAYILAPLPISISRKFNNDSYMGVSYNGRCIELAGFLTSIIVLSAYALPVVMARSPAEKPLIAWGSAAFICAGNTVIFLTIAVFMRLIIAEESSGW